MTKTNFRNRIISLLLAVIMCLSVFTAGIGVFQISSEAAEDSMTLRSKNWTDVQHSGGTLNNGFQQTASDFVTIKYTATGQPVYCVEPGVPTQSGTQYTEFNNYIHDEIPNIKTSADVKYSFVGQLIQLAGDSPQVSMDGYARYVAAQILIHEVLVEERGSNFEYLNPNSGCVAVKSLYKGSGMTQVNAYYNEFAGQVHPVITQPSFAGPRESVAPLQKLDKFDGTYFYTTLHDDNGMLKYFDFSASGVEFSKNGNDLTVKSKNVILESNAVTATGNPNTGGGGVVPGLVFWHAGSGDQILCSGAEDPAPKAYFKLATSVFGQIIVHKTSSDNSVSSGNGNYSLAGAQFRVTGPNGYSKVITTDASGVAKTENTLYLGTYQITEIKAPPGFTLNGTTQTVTISNSSPMVNAVFTEDSIIVNTPQKGCIRIQKETTPDVNCNVCSKVPEDNILSLGGAVFEIRNASGTLVDTVTTDSAGFAQSKQLSLGTYSIKETVPPKGYLVNNNIQDVTLSYTNQNETVVYKTSTVFEEHQHGRITIVKNDAETGANAQGKATLNGAVFTIKDKDTMTVLQTLACTDDSNKVASDLLPVGKTYIIEEITPPTGYNPTDLRYEVTLNADQTNNPVVETSVTVRNNVVRGSVKIIKSKEEIVDDTKVTTPFEGVEFILTSKTTGQKYTGDAKLTDKQGVITFSNLPYDDYIVHEVTPLGYIPLADFTVNVETQGFIYEYSVTNIKGTFELIVNKVDAETGKLINVPNASFQIYEDVNANETYEAGIDKLITWQVRQEDGSLKTTDTIYTSKNGVAMLPQKLDAEKKFLIKELTAPEGYVIESEYIPCDVSKGNSEIQQVLKFDFKNVPQKANLTIYKTGEQLIGATQKDSDYGLVYTPVYGVKGLAGAKFKIVAAEDIITADGTIRYTEGTVVATVQTGPDGRATCPENLYLGKYYVIETEAPDGYVLDTTPYEVVLEYAGQNIAVITKEVGITDERQKAEINVSKILELPDDDYTGETPTCDGIVFGLFAAEDIRSIDGTVAIPKDALIELLPLSADGKAHTTVDLPFGDYYLRELKTNTGYELLTEKYAVKFLYQGEETKVVLIPVNNGEDIVNYLEKLDLEIIKTSLDNRNIANIPFRVTGITLTGHTYEKVFYTNEEGKISISGLLAGNYTVTELECDENKDYIIPTSQEIDLITENGKVEFYNEAKTGTLKLQKTFEGSIEDVNANLFVNEDRSINVNDSDAVGDGETAPAVNAPKDVEFMDENGNVSIRYVKEGVPFHIWGTSDAGYVFDDICYTDKDGMIELRDLPIGTYHAEELTGEWTIGYIAEGEFEFSIKQDESTDITVNNEKIKGTFDFSKEDISTGDLIPDCGVRIKDERGNVIYEGRTDKDGKIVIGLEYGKYTYQEFDAPNGYELDESEYPFEIKENGEIVKAVMKDKPILTDVTVVKMEYETQTALPDAEFGLFIKGSDEAIQTAKTDENGVAVFTGLRYGDYVIKELTPPPGYVVNAEPINFTIDNKHDRQLYFEVFDVPVPQTGSTNHYFALTVMGLVVAMVSGGALVAMKSKRKKDE